MSTFVEQVMGKPAGSVVTLAPDYMIISDDESAAAVDEISTVADQEHVWVVYDHDVPTGSPEAAAVLRRNLLFARRHGCHYVQAKGCGYEYFLQEVIRPGQILLGGRHSGIFGAKGCLGIHSSVLELARTVETGRYSTVVPETVHVLFTGKLRAGVSAMDAGLAFLARQEQIAGKAIEFFCPGLDDHQQSVLCSMACMSGAWTAVVREDAPKAGLVLRLDEIEPMVMQPCASLELQAKSAICRRAEMEPVELQAGQIGGYTGGTIGDLRQAAAMLDHLALAQGFRLSICPATSRDYLQAMEEGLLERFMDYGAQIQAVGDHSRVKQGAGAMGPGESLVTTGLYTYAGAMGCEDAKIYTASVRSVILASSTKRIGG